MYVGLVFERLQLMLVWIRCLCCHPASQSVRSLTSSLPPCSVLGGDRIPSWNPSSRSPPKHSPESPLGPLGSGCVAIDHTHAEGNRRSNELTQTETKEPLIPLPFILTCQPPACVSTSLALHRSLTTFVYSKSQPNDIPRDCRAKNLCTSEVIDEIFSLTKYYF